MKMMPFLMTHVCHKVGHFSSNVRFPLWMHRLHLHKGHGRVILQIAMVACRLLHIICGPHRHPKVGGAAVCCPLWQGVEYCAGG